MQNEHLKIIVMEHVHQVPPLTNYLGKILIGTFSSLIDIYHMQNEHLKIITHQFNKTCMWAKCY